MNLRASFFVGLLLSVFACTSGSASDDCGAGTCGACQSGFVNEDRCVDGEWQCSCVPAPASASTAADAGGEGGDDAASTADPRPVFTCQQALASPTTPAVCAANDWDESCDQGCLTCRCNGGTWGCTTSPACFDAGGD